MKIFLPSIYETEMEFDGSPIPPVPELNPPRRPGVRDYVPLMIYCPACAGWHDTCRVVRVSSYTIVRDRAVLLRKCARQLDDGTWCLEDM